MSWFNKREQIADRKLSDSEESYLDLKAKLRELEIESDSQQKLMDMDRADLRSQLHRERADFEAQKERWQEKIEADMSNMKGTLLVKAEQDRAKIKNDYETKLNAEKERLNKKFYNDMTESLNKLHTEGNTTTQFMKDIALKMMDRHPSVTKQITIDEKTNRDS